MKKTFIYLFILLCFACRNKQEYTLCGTLYMDSNTVVDMLGIQMEDTLLYVKVDSAGYFSTTIPFREVVFCNLFGVAVTGEERWQFVTPVALQANASVDLDFHLTGGQTSIGATDPDNRALQAFREWSLNQSRTLWSNPPAGTELASRLARFPCEVQRITERERLDSTTAGYLSAWANIECLNLAHGLFRDSIPAALASALPVISQALDVPYWKLLYGSDLYISEYLQQNAPEPEDQIRLLQERFRISSIRENITLFADFPEEAVERAIRLSGLSGLILERGEDYLCGENGSGLSGGEKQRISIARSLLKNAQVLLVDEATAALDAQTAHQVSHAILDLSGMTRIVVTHTLEESALRRYDTILALRDGRIAEQGSFEELMERRGYFYSLYTISQ